ncbi:MAG: sigma-54-dependent transcriptional regulator [Phycisphaeraceae bacterium JB051]
MAKGASILIVDDIPEFLEQTAQTLAAHGYHPVICDDPRLAEPRLNHDQYDLLITTLVMREMGGFDLIRKVRGNGHTLPIVMITGFGSDEASVEAVRLGCSDYLAKPVEPEELISRVRRVLHQQHHHHGSVLQLDQMVSTDQSMSQIFQTAQRIAQTSSRVLILGETGTGKQLLAHAIHTASPRREHPFVTVNCAAIPDNLLESELFGHERGAFTDAYARRIGRFEHAGKGTIFLDEIGEMPLSLQAKLLHVLEDNSFTPVGSTQAMTSEARVIAATHRDLLGEIQRGQFRADLYYRLNVVPIHLPALRERPTDIPTLINHFIERYQTTDQIEPIKITAQAMHLLQTYHWPGNIRELQNLVERLMVLHTGSTIHPNELPFRIQHNAPQTQDHAQLFHGPFRTAKHQFESSYCRYVIQLAEGNMAQAAKIAEMDRGQFYRMAKRYGELPGK